MWVVKQVPSPGMEECEELWNVAKDFTTLSYYTVCCRQILRKTISPNIKIVEKGQAWARDGWLTNSHWNPKIDFMFHARKEADKIKYKMEDIGQAGKFYRQLDGPQFFPWFDTLKSPVILKECRNEELHWDHDRHLILPRFKILQHLNKWKKYVDSEFQLVAKNIRRRSRSARTIITETLHGVSKNDI